jgi:hypothetical protein
VLLDVGLGKYVDRSCRARRNGRFFCLSEKAKRFCELAAACEQRAEEAGDQSKHEFDVLARLWSQLADQLERLERGLQQPDT